MEVGKDWERERNYIYTELLAHIFIIPNPCSSSGVQKNVINQTATNRNNDINMRTVRVDYLRIESLLFLSLSVSVLTLADEQLYLICRISASNLA